MKRINNEQILDTIYDLADAAGMRIDRFLAHIEDTFGGNEASLEGLPEEIAKELSEARENKKASRRQERIKKSEAEAEAEIKRFREIFPEISAEDIPDEVWTDVENGATLSHAYALYAITQEQLNRRAEDINSRNRSRGASASSDGSTEPVFTKEQVEKMSGSDIKNNYKGILKAMKNWKFN